MDATTPLPTATVTFFLTDIEGSTRLWEQHPTGMDSALARHNALAAALVPEHGGTLIKHRGEGDSLFAVFARAADAVAAAVALQRALVSEPWPEPIPLRVRIALHTGDALFREGDYFGPAVNRCARLRAEAHGGQVLVSAAVQELVRDQLPEGVRLLDLGACRLRDLSRPEHVFQLLACGLPVDFPPLRALAAFRHNLPVQLTSFIGRQREIAEVKLLLAATRLLTLTGSGGCGKTRLALQVAADLLEEYADGVWLVELAPLADPALVPQAVAAALGMREEPGHPLTATLTDYLRSRSLLLVLDNCEHLLSACAHLADALLRSCPSLRMLASSREGLSMAGERTYRVPSLSLPDPTHLPPVDRLTEYEAVRLFIERAVSTQPSFALSHQNARAVVQVCQRLDGIPLAIELAAARVKALSVEKLNERLDDMFRLLTGGSRTALPRQQTLRSLIGWSYDLLSPSEQALLRRLSVFAGGWTLEAAEEVCAGEGVEEWEVLDRLTSLVERSLVLYEDREGEGRYRLLETVGQYARERLLEARQAEAMRCRHRDWFLRLGERAAPALEGPDQAKWFGRLEAEHDNLRAALEWSIECGEAELGLRLGGAIWRFWWTRGHHSEGQQRLGDLLGLTATSAPEGARARALLGAGRFAADRGDHDVACSHYQEAQAIYDSLGDKRGTADALVHLGIVARNRGNNAAARSYFEESLAICRHLGNRRGIAFALEQLGFLAFVLRDDAAARSLSEESLSIYRELDDAGESMARAILCLGHVALRQRDDDLAYSLYEQSLAVCRELGNIQHMAYSLEGIGSVAMAVGNYEIARSHLRDALRVFWQLGIRANITSSLIGFGRLAAAQWQMERAARLFGAATALLESGGAPLPHGDRPEYDRNVAAIHTALGEEAFAAAWAAGRALSLDDAVKLALQDGDDGVPSGANP